MSTRGDLILRTLAERAANPHHARREDESDAEYAARVKARLGKPRGDATAPCGHAGETVIGSYVRCLQGCDATGKAVDPLDVVAIQGFYVKGLVDGTSLKPVSVGYSAPVAPHTCASAGSGFVGGNRWEFCICGRASVCGPGGYIDLNPHTDAQIIASRDAVLGTQPAPVAAAPHVHVTQTATWVCQGVIQGNCACGAMRYVRNGVPGKWMEP